MVVKAFQPRLFSPPKIPLVGGWKVLLKFLLIVTAIARVILVIFRGKHRKNDAELFLTITTVAMTSPKFIENIIHVNFCRRPSELAFVRSLGYGNLVFVVFHQTII